MTATLLFIFGESLLISSIYFLGPITTFFLFVVVFIFLSLSVQVIYFHFEKSQNKVLSGIKKWINQKENKINQKKEKYLRYGKLLGLFLFSITAGPLPTSIFISLLGYTKENAFKITVFLNTSFFLIWILIYSGGIAIIKNLL